MTYHEKDKFFDVHKAPNKPLLSLSAGGPWIIPVGQGNKNNDNCENLLDIYHYSVHELHAFLEFNQGHWYIRPVDEWTEVKVNGLVLGPNHPCSLKENDVLTIGRVTLQVRNQCLIYHGFGATLEIRRLTYIHGEYNSNQEKILNEITFSLAANSINAIQGRSGCGKSTLLQLLAGIKEPSHGKILINGQTPKEYQTKIAYLPQDDVLPDYLSPRELLFYYTTLFKCSKRKQLVAQLLEHLELSGQAKQLIRSLSGGQRKRVSIAIELLRKPRLLLLDEPTTGLDWKMVHKLYATFQAIAAMGVTIVLVTHVGQESEFIDKIICMTNDGRISDQAKSSLVPAAPDTDNSSTSPSKNSGSIS